MKTFFRLFPVIALVCVAAAWVVGRPLGFFKTAPVPADFRGLEVLALLGLAMLVPMVMSEIVRAFREEDDRKTLEDVAHRMSALETQLQSKFQIIDSPSSPADYRALWADFSGDYWAYNPAYEVETRPGMDADDLVDAVFVARYKSNKFGKAYYLFLTGDPAGRDALEHFRRMMLKVRERFPRVTDKIEVFALPTKAASSEAESYRGVQSGRPTAIVEMTHGGLTRGRGLSHYYLRIHDPAALDRLRHHFDADWKAAANVDLWSAGGSGTASTAPAS